MIRVGSGQVVDTAAAEVGRLGFGEERGNVEMCETRLGKCTLHSGTKRSVLQLSSTSGMHTSSMARCRAPRKDRRTDKTFAGGMMSDFGGLSNTRDGKVILEPGKRVRNGIVGCSGVSRAL